VINGDARGRQYAVRQRWVSLYRRAEGRHRPAQQCDDRRSPRSAFLRSCNAEAMPRSRPSKRKAAAHVWRCWIAIFDGLGCQALLGPELCVKRTIRQVGSLTNLRDTQATGAALAAQPPRWSGSGMDPKTAL
jgi:hypothetical protein